MATFTDDQLIAAMKLAGQGNPSYVIRNWLTSTVLPKDAPRPSTAAVLRGIRRLEKAGRAIRSEHQFRSNMIDWDLW